MFPVLSSRMSACDVGVQGGPADAADPGPSVDPSYGESEECIWKAPDEKGLLGPSVIPSVDGLQQTQDTLPVYAPEHRLRFLRRCSAMKKIE